jgi:hypothetical protein
LEFDKYHKHELSFGEFEKFEQKLGRRAKRGKNNIGIVQHKYFGGGKDMHSGG